ncbi:MAG: HAD family hydrolase [Longimicrobiales bacterium]
MPFQAIFFDAGNTLLFVNPSEVLPIFREVGVEVSEERFWEAEFRARLGLSKRIEEGASGTEAHMWQVYFAELFRGCGVPEAQLRRVGERVWEVHAGSHLWTHIDAATKPALETLRARGHRLAVISNADGRVEALIRNAGIHHLFEFVIDSAVEGVEKPDPEIFLRGCRRMGVPPGECLYVGDLYPVDVLGARTAGMEALLLDPTGRLDFPVERIPNVAALPAYLLERKERISPQA